MHVHYICSMVVMVVTVRSKSGGCDRGTLLRNIHMTTGIPKPHYE